MYRFERDSYAFMSAYRHFRRTWGPRAAFHLARMTHGADWKARLVSAVWLAHERVPLDGIPVYRIVCRNRLIDPQ